MDKIAVLIPCYNEAPTIGKVVADFRRVLPEAVIYVYDNNSTDGTGEIAQAAGALVRRESRQGKGNVIRTMFRDIDARCYLMVDGDDTYPADCARQMADAVLEGQADMVVGDRLSSTYFTENKRKFHNAGNRLVRQLVNGFFQGHIVDIMTGYRAFSWLFVKSYPTLSRGFEIETEMTIHALDKNFHVVNVPVEYRDRPDGSTSKLNTYSDGAKVLGTIFRLLRSYKPFAFFTTVALVLVAIAAILFLPVFVEYLNTDQVARFPTLIVAGFVFLSGLLTFCCGLILDTVVKKDRQDFELWLNLFQIAGRENSPQDPPQKP